MKKSTLILCLLLSLAPGLVLAQSTVNYTAAPGQRNVLDVNGQPLADGNLVSVGFFDPGFDISTFVGDLEALDQAWNEYSTTFIETVFGEPGRFAGSDSSMDPVFDNEEIYLWIFQTTDNAAPDVSFSNVTGYGLYSSSLSNWQFPSQGSLPPANTTSVNSSEINGAMYGSFDANHLMLTAVPEPRAAAMLALGAIVALMLHRLRLR